MVFGSLLKKYRFLLLAFLLGVCLTYSIPKVVALAHGGDTILIHGCVGTGVLNQGRLRIIAASGTCNANETNLDWNIQGPAGPAGSSGGEFITNDLSNKNLNTGFPVLNSFRDFSDINFSNSNMGFWILEGSELSNSNFDGANLVGSVLNSAIVTGASFVGTQFGNINFVDFTGVNLTGSNMAGIGIEDTIFVNANLTNVNMSGALGTPDDITGANWSNTTCPDDTNSDNNGNTCAGHFIPL